MLEADYNINLEAKYQPLEVMDIQGFAEASQPWFNQTLCQVNDCVARLGVVHGDFHWHKHENEDEFFFVLEGNWIIELDDRTVDLKPGQGFLVPKGVMHCPKAPVRTVLLMFEGAGVQPTGD